MDNSLLIRHAASIVRAMLNGAWTNDFPEWASQARNTSADEMLETVDARYTRAVQTAEAFMLLLRAADPTFNEQAFLRACKLKKG
jgi:hypothetical protein